MTRKYKWNEIQHHTAFWDHQRHVFNDIHLSNYDLLKNRSGVKYDKLIHVISDVLLELMDLEMERNGEKLPNSIEHCVNLDHQD